MSTSATLTYRKNLTDKVICITGASAGIGWATAIACAAAGMDVIVAARRYELLQNLVQEIEKHGRRGLAIKCDVTNINDIQNLINQGYKTFGRLDAIMANAGRGLNKTIINTDEKALRDIFDDNLYSTTNLINAAIPIFQKQKHGHVLITSSCLSRFSLPYHGAYAATKAAQTQIARAMRLELLNQNIDVSVIHPITTITEFSEVSARISGLPNAGTTEHVPSMFVQPASRVADAIVKCLKKPVPEVWTSHIVRTLAGLMVMFPRLHDYIMRNEYKQQKARQDANVAAAGVKTEK